MRRLRNLWWLALGLAACAIPFNYPQDPETLRRHTLFHWWPRTKELA